MDSDEERQDAEPRGRSGGGKGASESRISSGPWSGSTAGGPSGGSQGYTGTALFVVAGVVVGIALFVAGFFTHSLLDDDVDLDPVSEALATLNQQTGQINERLGGAAASPTPAPLVPATADDDPFVGPEDASVTVIAFTDYQ